MSTFIGSGSDGGHALTAFATGVLGPVAGAVNRSWPQGPSRVWQLTTADGTFFLKQHQNRRFHDREVRALREWTAVLGDRAPRLVAADQEHLAVLLTEVPGRLLLGLDLDPRARRSVYRQLGELLRYVHDSAPPEPGPPPAVYAGGLERHLDAARPFLAPGQEAVIRAVAATLARLDPVDHVRILGDVAPRNVLVTSDNKVSLIDFERAELHARPRDLVRLQDIWADDSTARDAFHAGYGPLTDQEQRLLVCLECLDAVSGLGWGHQHGDAEVVERSRRTLQRLAAP